jgi:hypothetical protein
MTSEEIKAIVEPIRGWDSCGEATRQLLALYEIAYQLAVMNEQGKAMWASFPEPHRNDVNDVKWLTDQLRARDLARKTDREQNG